MSAGGKRIIELQEVDSGVKIDDLHFVVDQTDPDATLKLSGKTLKEKLNLSSEAVATHDHAGELIRPAGLVVPATASDLPLQEGETQVINTADELVDLGVLKYIKFENGKIRFLTSAFSDYEVSAKGSGSGSGGGSGVPAYDRLDRWDNYDSTKAGYVLSALLGYDLHTRIKVFEEGDYAPAAHKHAIADITDFPDNWAWTKISGKPSSFVPAAHNHTISEITDLQSVLDGKASSNHNHSTLYAPLSHVGDSSHLTVEQRNVLACLSVVDGRLHSSVSFVSEKEISAKGSGSGGGSGVPAYDRLDRWDNYDSTKAGYVLSALLGYDLHTRIKVFEEGDYAPAAHKHAIADITDFPDNWAWSKISGKPSSFTPAAHNHTISEITDLQSVLDGKASSNHNHSTLYAPLSHVGDSTHLTTDQKNILACFSIVDGKVCVNKSFYSTGEVSAKGAGDSGSGGTSYERLDKWGDYTTAKAGYVLSAFLGNDLHTRLKVFEEGDYVVAGHKHVIADITNFPQTWAWTKISGKPSSFTPAAHSHSEYALTSHTHPYLPLTAGSSYPITGPLFTKSQVNIGNAAQSYRITLQEQPNGVAYIYNQDHNGTATANLQLGNPAIVKSLFYNANTGRWGIGMDNPYAKLSVKGSMNITLGALSSNPALGTLMASNTFSITNTGNDYGLYSWVRTSGNTYLQSGRGDTSASTYNLVLQALGGMVLIGTETGTSALTVGGSVLASGGYLRTSSNSNLLSIGSRSANNIHLYKESGTATTLSTNMHFNAQGNIEANGGYLYSKLNGNTIRLGSGTTDAIHFYKMSGDATRFEMNLSFKAVGNITASSGYLYSILNGITTQIGAQNSSHTHYTTTAGSHWFNKGVRVDGHVYGGPGSYNRRLAYVDEIAGIKVNNAVNADTVAGLGVHAGVNNQANKIVRTDGNGYIYAGWINTTSGALSSAPSRIYCSNDSFIRYQTPAAFHASVIGDGAYNFYAKSAQCAQTITVAGDKDTYYPVVIQMIDNGNYIQNIITITKWLGQRSGEWAGNHGSHPTAGAAGIYRYEYRTSRWDGNAGYLRTLHAACSYAPFVAHTKAGIYNVGGLIIYLRGGNAEYSFVSNNPASFTVYYAATNLGSTQYPVNVAPRTDIGNAGIYNSISFPVVALKAQQLETSRTLWGQSFDGTGNVSGALTGVTDLTASGTISAGRVCAGYDSGAANTLNCAGWVYSQTGYYITAGVYYTNVSSVACITSATNEFIVSGKTDSSIYVNYRKSHQGYAPGEWYWKAGSSTSWADHFLGNLTLNGTTLRFASSPQVLVPSQSYRLALLAGSSAAGINVWNLWVSENYSVDSSKLRSGGIYSRAGMIADGDITIHAGGIKLNTAASRKNGYSFYSPSWTAWQMYMCPAGSAGGVNGTLTAPAGQFVTTWALRSAIEPSSGYGWTWETVSSTGTASSIVAELSTLGHFRVVGNITAAGEVSAKRTSDERFKENVRTIIKGSDVLKCLRPVEFQWNDLAREYNHEKTGKSASFIAQEMQKILPWAVSRMYDGKYLGINKEAVIPYLVSGWQEHDDEISKLKRRITELENEIIKLKNAS